MKKLITILTVVLITTNIFAQEEVSLKNGKIIIVNSDYTWKYKSDNSFTDPRDGKTYKTIKIGTQIWMAENLAYKTTNTLDKQGNSLAWCTEYPNNIRDAAKYGYLYSFEAAKIACPSGWHLPTDAEWEVLINFLGGANIAGGKMKEAGTTHWNSPNIGASNISGFTALPGGYHNDGAGHYENISEAGCWWSSTKNNDGGMWIRTVVSTDGKAYRVMDIDYVPSVSFSVRCVKDATAKTESSNEKPFIDRVCGEWKYKDANNKDGFFKITKRENGKIYLQKGIVENNKMSWGNMDETVGNGVTLELLNESLVGKCRIFEGSAPDAYYDTNFNIGFKTGNILLFKTIVHTGGGANFNESFEATKMNK